MPTENAPAPVSEQSKPTIVIGEFGAGRYSGLMLECFHDAQAVFALEPDRADKLARLIGSEVGAIMARNTTGITGISFSKVSKDGKVTVKEAASKVKGATFSYPLFCLRTLAYVNGLGEHGILRGKLNFTSALDEKLTDWLDKKI